ncbi:MAG: hypothetical protein WAN93_02180 [Solirubrobacteraceae bacterium]
MDSVVGVVRMVITADGGIREAIQDKSVDWIVASPACRECTNYLVERDNRDIAQIDMKWERRRGASLLLILAAMQLGSAESTLEALRSMATRSVDTRGLAPALRLRKAGEARKRPITSERHYVRYGHAARMQQRLSEELYVLITHIDLLKRVLAENGEKAVARYL